MKDPVTVLTVVGARPQFVKAATVSRVLGSQEGMREVLVHTGQHYDKNMSGSFFSELAIPAPKYNLRVGSGPHGAQTGSMLASIEQVVMGEKPDWVLVYGDTNSTLAGALAAAKLHVPVAHVEAGMRSFNRRMPEEINRVLTDHVALLNFSASATATQHLFDEGITAERVLEVGDVMYDAARFYGRRAGSGKELMGRLGIEPGRFFLATAHRAENVDDTDRMGAIVSALIALSKDRPVIFPLHPRTRNELEKRGDMRRLDDSVIVTEPLSYLDMVVLVREAAVVITDSGGVQKESFFFETPCVTVRDETEWVELVDAGWNRIVPPVCARDIIAAVDGAVDSRGSAIAPYGRGDAANRVVEALAEVSG